MPLFHLLCNRYIFDLYDIEPGVIPEIVNGKLLRAKYVDYKMKKAPETKKENILAFSLGMGSEDLIVSHFVYNEAKKRKLGKSLNLF